MCITATMNKLRHRVYKCNDVLFTFFYSDWFIILFDHKFCQFNPTKFYKYKQFNFLKIPPLRTFGSASAFYFIKTCTSSFITEAGEIRNKYRPVTDFVRVVSVGACPKPMTVDTPVRFIRYFRSLKRFWDCEFNFVNVLELHRGMEEW
jgi:hypothetical protein